MPIDNDVHPLLVQAIIKQMEKAGYKVTEASGIRGYKEPTKTGRHAPDVKGYHKVTRAIAIGEAKRAGDLQKAHTHEQLVDFANAYNKNDGTPIPFYIAVARHCLLPLQTELNQLGIDAKREHIHVISVGVKDPTASQLQPTLAALPK